MHIPHKFKETGFVTAMAGVTGLVTGITLVSMEAAGVPGINAAPMIEEFLALSLPLILGGKGYRAFREGRKTGEEKARDVFRRDYPALSRAPAVQNQELHVPSSKRDPRLPARHRQPATRRAVC